MRGCADRTGERTNSKLARNVMVSSLPIEALEKLAMRYPEPVPGAADAEIV